VSGAWLGVAATGALVLGASMVAARGSEIPRWEALVFRAVNRLPNWLYVPLWPVMQLGNLVVGTAAGLAVAWGAGELSVAVGVVLAMVLKLAIERLLRRAIGGHLPARTRPGTSEPDAILRGDVPPKGRSFPSGHVVLVGAVACVVGPVLPGGWEIIPFVLTGLVMVGRVYVGAHNPLDTTAGLGAGLVLGGIVASFIQS
jgi:undecaprenyl-diphosphatase